MTAGTIPHMGGVYRRADDRGSLPGRKTHQRAPKAQEEPSQGSHPLGEKPASSTAMMPVRKMPSKVPAPPIEATGAPSPGTASRLRRSAPISVPRLPLGVLAGDQHRDQRGRDWGNQHRHRDAQPDTG